MGGAWACRIFMGECAARGVGGRAERRWPRYDGGSAGAAALADLSRAGYGGERVPFPACEEQMCYKSPTVGRSTTIPYQTNNLIFRQVIGSRAPVGSRALYRSRRSRTHSHSCSRCNPDSRTRRSRGSCNRSNRHRTPGARSTPHHCSTLGTRSPRPCSTEWTRGSRQCSCRSRCSSWWICAAAPSLKNLRKPQRAAALTGRQTSR